MNNRDGQWSDQEAFELARRLCDAHGADPDKPIYLGNGDVGENWQVYLLMAVEALFATKVATLRILLKEARQYVSDAGSDEDGETRIHSESLLTAIDAALASQETVGEQTTRIQGWPPVEQH